MGDSGRDTGMISHGDLPGLQRHVAVEHPAVLKLDGLGRGGQVIGRGGRGMDLTPPIGQRVPVEGVGGRVVMGQCVVVRGWQRWPQSRLAVVWRAWEKRKERGPSVAADHSRTLRQPGEVRLEPASMLAVAESA